MTYTNDPCWRCHMLRGGESVFDVYHNLFVCPDGQKISDTIYFYDIEEKLGIELKELDGVCDNLKLCVRYEVYYNYQPLIIFESELDIPLMQKLLNINIKLLCNNVRCRMSLPKDIDEIDV